MEPFTLTLIAAATIGVVGSLAGFVTGRIVERHSGEADTLRANLNVAEREAKRHEGRIAYLEGREETNNRDLKQAREQRDRYREMAESHEVKIPPAPGPEVVTRKVWDGRRFSGTPENNLRNLQMELLKVAKGKEVAMSVEIVGTGTYWSQGRHLKEQWKSGNNRTAELGPIRYHGTAERAFDDFHTFVTDNDTNLVRVAKGRKVWKDHDSPLLFKVTLEIKDTYEPKVPEVHIVEVAVVQEEVVERIVEKEVVISIPEGREPELSGHSREEIQAIVDERLARLAAEAEVEDAVSLASGTPKESERTRLARAARAAGKIKGADNRG